MGCCGLFTELHLNAKRSEIRKGQVVGCAGNAGENTGLLLDKFNTINRDDLYYL